MVDLLGRCGVVLGRVLLGMSALVAGASAQTGQAAPDKPAAVPVADFFRADAMARPLLSPSGKHLAVHVGAPNGRTRLAVLSVDPPRTAVIVAGFDDTSIHRVQWVNDDRLVFTVADWHQAGDHWSAPGLYAVDRDGKDLRMLVQRSWQFVAELGGVRVPALTPNHGLLRVLRDGTADVVVQRRDYDGANREVVGATALRLDTRTGRTRPLDTGWLRNARQWVVDNQGAARALFARQDDQLETWWRPGPGAEWVMIDRQPLFVGRSGGLVGLRLGLDGQLYAETNGRHSDGTSELYRFDTSQRRLEAEPLVSVQGFDFEGHLIFDGRDKSLLGVRYLGDAWSTAWLSTGMQAVQARIDAQLPGLINLVDVAECGCSRWLVVSAYSDRQPALFWLYDREADRLEPVGQAQPQIDPRRMASRDFLRFKARDGMDIPLHVTRPQGKGPWPTVVLVHGGPHVRGGDWAWDGEAQFLASRGYLVLEPEFRGSTGYGGALFAAGFKQWGLKSQDDIADALGWAVAKGEADASRACIAGGSYGGYAALMGLIRDDKLFRCGLAWMAVTDIGLMFELKYSDLADIWRQYGMPQLIGDPQKDAAQLAATSPLQQAARLKRPLLLAAGGVDRRVPIAHSTRFKAALPADYSGLTWIVYPDEGHGLAKPETRVDFWRQVEAFLARELAPR